MQQRSFLRVVLSLAVGFCGIAAGQSTTLHEAAAARCSVIHIDTCTILYPTSTITVFHMPVYDRLFGEAKPVAIQLRQNGWTPQAICTEVASVFFGDKNKYNTVKGWYQRTFDDWPSDGHKSKDHTPLQNGLSNQHRAFNHSQLPPDYFASHQRESFLQRTQNLAGQQALSADSADSANSHHRPIYPHYQAVGATMPMNDNAAIYRSGSQTYHYPPNHHHPPFNCAIPYNVYQLSGPQDLPRSSDLQTSPGQYVPLPQNYRPARESDANAAQLSIGAIRPPHQQYYHQFQQNGYPQKATTQPNEGGSLAGYDVLGMPNGPCSRDLNKTDLATDETQISFLEMLGSDSLDLKSLESMRTSLDGQRFTLQSTAAPKQPFLAHANQVYPLSQIPRHQSASQAAYDPLATGPCNDQLQAFPSHPQSPFTLRSGAPRTTRASSKHYPCSSILTDDPTPAPQFPPPQNPPATRVIRKGHGVKSWLPVHVKEGSVVAVDPNRLPTDHPPKRVKGVGTKSHDSMVIHSEHLRAPQLVAPGTSASYSEQAATARVPLNLRPVNWSNISVCSSLRDSGYISVLDSTVDEAMQSSLSALKLTDTEYKKDYREADDGSVEAELTIKGRWRRSHIERMHPPVYGPDSSALVTTDRPWDPHCMPPATSHEKKGHPSQLGTEETKLFDHVLS